MNRWFGLALVGLLACGAAGDPPPVSDLSTHTEAKLNFDELDDRYRRSDSAVRLQLIPGLLDHVERYGNDASARIARSRLALLYFEQGDQAAARRMAEAVQKGPPGASYDLATVVLGGLARRQGQPERSAELLRPLLHRLIDPVARTMLNRELMFALLEAKQTNQVPPVLHALIRQASLEDRKSALEDAARVTPELEPRALFRLLAREHERPDRDRALLGFLTGEVTTAVLAKEDPELAEELLALVGDLLDERADAVARVAARAAEVRLDHNTVGFLLSLRTDELRRRSMRAAEGLAFALGIPGSKTRLLTRDDMRDASRLDEAFALLNADGAALIVGGVDQAEADALAAYSERTGLPVMLLRPPRKTPAAAGAVFVLGPAPSEPRQPLFAALQQHTSGRIAALLGDRDDTDALSSDPRLAALQFCGASLEFVRTSGAEAILIDGPPDCSATALAGVAAMPFAVGLEGPQPTNAFRLKIGTLSNPQDPAFASWKKRFGDAPGWWQALGHDAGVLIADAVEMRGQADNASQRRALVQKAVESVQADLWTTTERGFAGRRKMTRSFTVLDPVGPQRKPKR